MATTEVGWFRRHLGWTGVYPLLDDKAESLRRTNWVLVIIGSYAIAWSVRWAIAEPSPSDGHYAIAVGTIVVMFAWLLLVRWLIARGVLRLTWRRPFRGQPDTIGGDDEPYAR